MRRPTFDLDVLRSFVLGIELGSFAKAADRLGRSTSAVSAQLKKLEEQIDLPIVQKSGRGIVLTARGEILFGYAKRLLALNDEASSAVCGADLDGCIRLGLQEDFGEHLLTEALGRFTRAHPRVHIEARVARNKELIALLDGGQLDLALAWDSGERLPYSRLVATLPMCWIVSSATPADFRDQPLPLIAFEAPCLMRSAATSALDSAGIPWRVTFTSSSLSGIWAAASAGLGITVRTSVGLPPNLRPVEGLPELPEIGLLLHRKEASPSALMAQLEQIILSELVELLPAGCTVPQTHPAHATNSISNSSTATFCQGSSG